MDLEVLYEDCLLFADEFAQLIQRRPTIVGEGDAVRNLCRCYRAIGIYDYLLNFDTRRLLYGLIQSALTRKHFLEATHRLGADHDPGRRASLCDPFFDALVANQFALAQTLVELSPKAVMTGFEYEDDYLYGRILYGCVGGGQPERSLVERFESVLEGQDSPRFDVCLAFFERDQEAFGSAFERVLSQYQQTMSEYADPQLGHSKSQQWDFEANRRFFVEGVALLKLAERAGFVIIDDYVLCPRISVPQGYVFEPESFPMIQLQ